MATRPCLSSAARYHVSASGDVFEKPKGSQSRRSRRPPSATRRRPRAAWPAARARRARRARARPRRAARACVFGALGGRRGGVALGPACVFLLRSRGLGSARGGRRRRRDRRGAQLLGPGVQRGRRRRRRRRAKRPFATAVQWVNAGCLRWPFGGRPKPFDRRAAPLSSQRPGSWPLLYLRVSAKRRPKRLEPLTMRQKLSSASSRHGGALCYGHFGASLRQSLPSQFYPPL